MKRTTTTVFKQLGAVAFAGLITASAAQAATISFSQLFTTTDNPVIDTAPSISVNDDTSGFLTFNISIANANALLTGIFVDIIGNPDVEAGDLASLTPGTSINPSVFDTNTNSINPGPNLNGSFNTNPAAPSGAFTFGFGLQDGDPGGAGRQVDLPFAFTLTDFGSLSIFDVSRIGLRFQSVGTLGQDGLGGGSEKIIALSDFDSAPPPPAPVPLPAALPLLLAGLGALGVTRARRKKS